METRKIVDTIVEVVKSNELQGLVVLNSNIQRDYSKLILLELNKLENLSVNYKSSLIELSKFIRNDIWENHDLIIYSVLNTLNKTYALFSIVLGEEQFWSIETVIEYAIHFFAQVSKYGIEVTEDTVDHCIDSIEYSCSKSIVEKQWEDIFKSADGNKSFYETFNDIFENAISKYEDAFIHKMSSNDVLCRMVKEKICNTNRFIPYPNLVHNRWNPPGKTFLYLSYDTSKIENYKYGLTKSEYICLLECRTKENTDCCFCYFHPETEGRIIDLSYNDIELSLYRKQIESHVNNKYLEIFNSLLKKYENHMESINEEIIRSEYESNPLSADTIAVISAKKLLQLICKSIYKEVDSNQEKAYSSFHLLAEYLISKGITGIIYPCTRDERIKGKNIVLFDINDATPIADTIKQFHYD